METAGKRKRQRKRKGKEKEKDWKSLLIDGGIFKYWVLIASCCHVLYAYMEYLLFIGNVNANIVYTIDEQRWGCKLLVVFSFFNFLFSFLFFSHLLVLVTGDNCCTEILLHLSCWSTDHADCQIYKIRKLAVCCRIIQSRLNDILELSWCYSLVQFYFLLFFNPLFLHRRDLLS